MKHILATLFLLALPALAGPVSSTAYEASHVLATGPSRLHIVVGFNSKASAQFIQIHDAATLPANGAVPRFTFTVPATSNFSLALPSEPSTNQAGATGGFPFVNGIVICNSSTGNTLTVGSADCFFTANSK